MFGGALLLGGRGPVEHTGRDTGTDPPLLEWLGLEEAMAGLGFEPETDPGGLASDPPLLLWGGPPVLMHLPLPVLRGAERPKRSQAPPSQSSFILRLFHLK